MPDVGRAAHRDHEDAVAAQVAALPGGQRLQRGLVAHALHQHDRAGAWRRPGPRRRGGQGSAAAAGRLGHRRERSLVHNSQSGSRFADCGFSSQATYTPEIHPAIVWAKFESLAEGARRATGWLWP